MELILADMRFVPETTYRGHGVPDWMLIGLEMAV